MAEPKARLSPLSLLGDALLMLCAAAGLTGSFLSLYGAGETGEWTGFCATPLDLCAAGMGEALCWAALLALAALCVWSLPRFRLAAAGGLAALWAGAVYVLWEDAVQGAGVTLRVISQMFAYRVGGEAFSFPTPMSTAREAESAGLFLLLSLAMLVLILGWAVVRARRWWLAVLLTLPPLLPGLLADLYPSWPAFLALAACWCAMLLGDLCKWAAPDRRGALTLVLLPAAGLALAGLTLLLPMEGYTRPGWALRAEEELHRAGERAAEFFSQWEGPFSNTVTFVGAAGEADLNRAGAPRYSGRTVLRVNTGYSGHLYLHGAALGRYEGGRWTELGEEVYQEYLDSLEQGRVYDAPSPLLFPAHCTQSVPIHRVGDGAAFTYGAAYTATVENLGDGGVYVPYQLLEQDWLEAGVTPARDSYLARRTGQNRWSVAFAPPMMGMVESGPLAERYYRLFVREHYLDVPDELADELAWLCRGLSPSAMDGVGAARRVAQVLDQLCEYDLDTPAAPKGVDPVLYFLTESRQGYCMHFASAAALMLRTMGIPARYVSGYTAQTQSGQWVNVPDRAAHAWVEVYVDGYGWYPVEVTPAAAFDWVQPGQVDSSQPPSDPLPESGEPTPEPSPTPTPEPEPSPTPTPGPEDIPAPSREPQGASDGEGEPETGLDLSFLLPWLKGLAGAAGVSALLWLGQYLPKRRRIKKLSGPDPNRAALEGYGCLLRLERWGGQVDERALELAQKARFSQHTLTGEELDELRALVDGERARLCASPPVWRRLAALYVWGRPEKGKTTGKSPENRA